MGFWRGILAASLPSFKQYLNTMTELCVIQLLFPAMLHKMASDVLRDIDRESGYFYLGPLAAIRLPIPLPDSGD